MMFTVELRMYSRETVAQYRHRTAKAAYRRLRAIINGKAKTVDKAARHEAEIFMIRDERSGMEYALTPFAARYLDDKDT